jgi:bacillolysin
MATPGTHLVQDPFFTYRLHSRSEEFETSKISGALGERSGEARAFQVPEKISDPENAARFHLQQLFEQETEAPLRTLLAEDRPQVLPDLNLRDVLELPKTETLLVRFRQAYRSVPIFGSNVVVEIESSGKFVSVNASLTPPPDVPVIATITVEDALRSIAKVTARRVENLRYHVSPPVQRLLYRHESGSWHLVYVFSRVPAAPQDVLLELREVGDQPYGIDLEGRAVISSYEYFVDANSGDVLLYYSSDPQFASTGRAIPPPTQLDGYDEDGVLQTMDGTSLGSEYELTDPLRKIKTFDMGFKDAYPTNLPANALRSTSTRITLSAAVSAHVNATKVWKFYNSVLSRQGIDGKCMELISVVNCLDSSRQPPPEWKNAAWSIGRMWYGQVKDNGGKLRSYSRYLDIIAHELTHGVTEATAGLMYKNESGALDESISDIFGVIISNHVKNPTSVRGWNWEIGPGLGVGGGPLRNFSDPTLTSDPDHMNNYAKTSRDSGGVHKNSNIHNKATYNLLKKVDASGAAAFPPEELALLYYLAITRLAQTAGFADMRDALEDVVMTRYANPVQQQHRIADVRDAYRQVGIT